MKVYRLERNGYGVFCSLESGVGLSYQDDGLYSGLGYTCEPKYHFHKDWRSACESIKKLIDYFGSDFDDALRQGASIVEYTVPKRYVMLGYPQDTGFDISSVELIFNVLKATRRIVLQGEDDKPNTSRFVFRAYV